MNEPFLSQKRHVLTKLEMARSGQGWRRLKICLPILLAKIRSRDSSHPTSGVTESKTSLVISIRSLMSIPNMAPVCWELGLRQGLNALASSSLCSLAPSFDSPSPSFAPFFFFSFLLSSSPPSYSCPPSSFSLALLSDKSLLKCFHVFQFFFLLLHLFYIRFFSWYEQYWGRDFRETLKASSKDTWLFTYLYYGCYYCFGSSFFV